jgi:hypothetical protein
MNSATCAVLTSVFPLILIAVVAERRSVHMKIRKTRVFRRISVIGTTTSLIGLPMSIVGVATSGFDAAAGGALWALLVFSIVSIGFCLLAATVTHEIEEDAEDEAVTTS